MIEHLTYVSRSESAYPWAGSIPYFQSHPDTELKPGLNVLFGANGSGKSTFVQLIAKHLAAAQGGTSVVTQTWLLDLFGFGSTQIKLPCTLIHDGTPIMFYDARATEGLVGGAFDDDFFMLGIANTLAKGSTGELAFNRLGRMLKVLLDKGSVSEDRHTRKPEQPEPAPAAARKAQGRRSFERPLPAQPKSLVPEGFPDQIEWRVSRSGASGTWAARVAAVESMLAGNRPIGPRTLIFDEPESGLSIPLQAALWSNVLAKVDPAKFQVIVATHSPFALGIDGANYIEMSPGYLSECEDVLKLLGARI